jgi:hypothetical protein
MTRDDLDRILSKEQEIIPSSGFVVSVMDTVRRETAAPRPIPFPWKRALPGLSAAGIALMSVLVVGVVLLRGTATRPLPAGLLSAFALIFQCWKTVGASWIALALLLSFASVRLSSRFVPAKRDGV